MKWGLSILALCALLAATAPEGGAAEQGGGDAKLLKMVVLSRHGVRSPTQSSETLESWSRKDWPEWPVKRGELTPRGAKLVTAMWEQEAAFLREAGLLPSKGCPEAGTIAVRADRDQRTRVTGEAVLEGLAPGVRVQAYRERDGPSRSAVPSVGGRILRARSLRCSQGNSRRRD